MANDKKRNRIIFAIVIIAIIAIGFNVNKTMPTKTQVLNATEWQAGYVSQARTELVDYSTYTSNTDYYDYDNPKIEEVSKKILSESSSTEDAIQNTLSYVYANIDYTFEGDNSCFSGTAPTILASGKGQCDTQSIVVISLLRKMGIASAPVGGCIQTNTKCQLQAIFTQSFAEVFRPPQYQELTDEKIATNQLSRGGIMSRTGGLHAYVVAWIPGKGWVPLESTAGKFADTNCYYYHVELFPGNNDKSDICISKNLLYAQACQSGDITSMDKYGKGLVTDVNPFGVVNPYGQ